MSRGLDHKKATCKRRGLTPDFGLINDANAERFDLLKDNDYRYVIPPRKWRPGALTES